MASTCTTVNPLCSEISWSPYARDKTVPFPLLPPRSGGQDRGAVIINSVSLDQQHNNKSFILSLVRALQSSGRKVQSGDVVTALRFRLVFILM